MQDDKNNALRADVKQLGHILGNTLKEQAGEALFDLEEKIRELCKNNRLQNDYDITSLQKQIAELSPESLIQLAKAFGLYFQLVNTAEQNHRIRRKRDYAMSNTVINYSLEHMVSHLQEQQLGDTALQSLLNTLHIMPVLTAHPTHIMRQTLLQKHRRISQGLFAQGQQLTPQESKKIQEQLRHEVALLWQSNPFHGRKITVMDEVDNLLRYFDESLWDTLPQLHEDLEVLLKEQGYNVRVPVIMQFGSWVGGDRDGHPFVTPELTYQTLRKQQAYLFQRYAEALNNLEDHYSTSTQIVGCSDELMTSIAKDAKEIGAAPSFYDEEPYRQKLYFMRQRFLHAKTLGYASVSDFLRDLQCIHDSLLRHQGACTLSPLVRLQWQARIFGFCLMPLDIRQDSALHLQAVGELLKINGVHDHFEKLPEAQKQEILCKELANPRPLYSPCLENPAENAVYPAILETLLQVKAARAEIDPQSIQRYIISMCRQQSDLLNVYLLLKAVGLFSWEPKTGAVSCALEVIPLFETVDDLQRATSVMEGLFNQDFYKAVSAQQGQLQEVMIGYSDSSKSGGILAATWNLYVGQRRLSACAEGMGIQIQFFHGRGGTVSRGGGPTRHAIHAQPEGTIKGRIRMTEQGEVLSWKYNFKEMAHRNLSVLLSSVLEASLPDKNVLPKAWESLMNEMAEVAYEVYGEQVQSSDFIHYFQQATPLKEISELNIGSRPAKRKDTRGIEDLRAIPWVFSWMQSRCVFPAWFGVGSAFEKVGNLATLQEMYTSWPFFTSFLDNLHMTLSKADIHIASCYAELAEPRYRDSVWPLIEAEYHRTCKWVLSITQTQQLLEKQDTLRRSIALRNPYVDPLNYIQVEVLKRLRNGDEHPLLKQALDLSIIGISEGLRNTG